MGDSGSNSEVQISIVVVDKGGNETIQALGAALQGVEAQGASAGAAVAASLESASTAAKQATSDVDWFDARMRALRASSPSMVNAPIAGGGKTVAQLTAEWQAEQDAIKAADAAAKAASKGAVGLAGSYGEARIAASALVGSTRGMAIGLANVGARARWLAPLWQAAMPIAVGVAAVSILAQVGEEAYNLYEKYIDLDAAASKYNDEVQKKKTEDFINVHTIETARMRLDEATDSVGKLRTMAETMRGGFWSDVMGGFATGGFASGITAGAQNLMGSRQLADASAQSAAQRDALMEKEAQLQGRIATLRIETAHAGDSELKGYAAINAELNKQIALHAQEAQNTRDEEHAKGNRAWNDVGQQQRLQDEQSQAEAAAKRVNMAENESAEVMRLREQANEAGKQGNALYYAQEQAAIDEVTRKFLEGQTSRGAAIESVHAIQDRFFAEAQSHQQELDEQTRKMEADAATAGLTGIARIQAENLAALAAIDARERKEGGGPQTENADQYYDFNRQRDATSSEGQQKQAEAERQYYDEMNSMMEGFAGHSQEGYARITADAQKSAQEVWTKWSATWGQMTAMDAGWVESVDRAAQLVGQINQNAATESARLHQQTMDQLRREEELAARDSLPPWIAAEMAIVDTYNDRVNKAREALGQQKIDQDEYNQEMVTASAVAQAQMQKQMEETRDKLASSLQSFFQNPTKYIEQRAMDTGFQFLGNQMMQMFQSHSSSPAVGAMGWLFGMNGQASTSTNPSTFGRSLLGMGGQHTGIPGIPGMDGGSTFSAGATTLQTGATTLQTASQTLMQAAQSMMTGGGGGGVGSGIGSDLAMPGFGGISAGSTSTGLGSATGAAAVGGLGGGAGSGIGDADIAQLSGSTGPDATGTYSSIGGGLSQNAATTAGSSASPWLGAASAGITGAMGLYSAYSNSNPIAGGISGAMSGAAIGSAIAPGIGTVIGAMAGGIAGILAGVFGDQGKGSAQQLDWNTVQPGIATELQQYNSGQAGYNQVAQYLDQLQIQAMNQTNSLGSGARGWYTGHILPEIQAAQAQLAQEEKGGRSLVALSAAQYHSGGMINDFGDLAINSDEGYILAQRGERMMTASTASTYGPALDMMHRGAVSPGAMRGNQMVPAATASGGFSPTIVAWDAQSVQNWLNRGGATLMRQGANMATGQYGGNGVR